VQPPEITSGQAVIQAPEHCAGLLMMARRHRASHRARNQCQTIRHWQSSAGTWCYQTHIALENQPGERLAWLAEVFYSAATLAHHPWYPEFDGGRSQELAAAPARGVDRHQLSWGRFDLGLSSPRYYRQLVSLALPAEHTAVIAARSVTEGPPLPEGAALAYTVAPNGEVLHFDGKCLHWHHICTTTGAAVLPGRLDRWLINALRFLRVDGAERNTYRREAEQLRDWLQTDNPGVEYAK